MTTVGIQAINATSVLLPVGGLWTLLVDVRDADGEAVAVTPTAVVTLPSGSTTAPTFAEVTPGRYRATYTTATAGRHVAVVTATDLGVTHFAAYATGATTAAGMPTTDDVANYIREGAASWEEEDLQDALDAEAAAQRAACRVRAVYPDDLRQALLRRVQRNLAMRQLPLAVLQGDAEVGTGVLPGRDPEVRRFEAPHRKLVVG